MRIITYSEARQNFAETMHKVCEDNDVVYITRQPKEGPQETVVMLSLEEYQSLDETAYLLKSPKNREDLLRGLKELDAGKGVRVSLDQLSDTEGK